MIQSICSQNRRGANFGHNSISPKYTSMPGSTEIEHAVEAAGALTAAFKSAHFPSPITQDQEQMSAINKLACIFNTAMQPEKRSMEN